MGGVEGLRFLCDEHVGIPVYRALKRVRLDIVHLLALGMGGTSDPAVLQYARDEGRILLTRNYKDFAPLVEKWAQRKEGFPGVLFIATSIPQADAGAHVRALKAWMEKAEVYDLDDEKLIIGRIAAAERLKETYEPLIYREEDYG